MAEQLIAARIASEPGVQIIDATNPATKEALDLVLEDFAFVRGALLDARATGNGLSDAAIAYINARRAEDGSWFQNLTRRVVRSGGAGQFFRAADENLVAELQGLFDQRGSAIAPRATAPPTAPSAVADALRLSQSLLQLAQTTGQTVKAVGELPQPPPPTIPRASAAPTTTRSAATPTPAPANATQLASLQKHKSPLQVRPSRGSLRPRPIPELSGEARAAARRDYYVALDDISCAIRSPPIRFGSIELWDSADNLTTG